MLAWLLRHRSNLPTSAGSNSSNSRRHTGDSLRLRADAPVDASRTERTRSKFSFSSASLLGTNVPTSLLHAQVVTDRAQDKFLLAPLLPHKCGVPPGYGTPHLCGSEELCRAPLRTKWSGRMEWNPVRCLAFLRESSSNWSTCRRFPRTRCSLSGRQYAALCSSNFSIFGRSLKDF